MKIRDCMKRNVVSIPVSATLGEAARTLADHNIGMLPVVDESGRLVGLLHLRDLMELVMPTFVRLVEDFDFVHDFGAVELTRPSPGAMQRPVREVMQEPVIVDESCGLVRAFAILHDHGWYDLPVVSADRRLVGVASRVDIGAALLSSWGSESKVEGA
jgi:CBS domain-containing protein